MHYFLLWDPHLRTQARQLLPVSVTKACRGCGCVQHTPIPWLLRKKSWAAQLKQACDTDHAHTLASSLITAVQMSAASGNTFTTPHPSTVSTLPLLSQVPGVLLLLLLSHLFLSSMPTHSGDQENCDPHCTQWGTEIVRTRLCIQISAQLSLKS